MDEKQEYCSTSSKIGICKTFLIFAVAICLIVVSTNCSFGQPLPKATNVELKSADDLRNINTVLQQRGSVVFRDTPLHEVLYSLGEQWKINIVAGADVTGLASGVFRDATLQEILNAILTVNGYGYRQNGGSLVVLPQAAIGPNNPNFRAETLLLPKEIPVESMGEIVDALGVFSSPMGGKIQPIPSSNRIVVYDSPDQIAAMQKMLATLLGSNANPAQDNSVGIPLPIQSTPGFSQVMPVSNEIIKIRPQFVSVNDVAKAVELAIGSTGTFTTIENEQLILVSGSPEVVARASFAAQQVDVARTQVRITSFIYDVSLGELERLGFDWSSQAMSQAVDSNGIPVTNSRLDGGLLTRNPPAIPVQPVAAATTAVGATAGAAGAAGATAAGPTGGQWFFRTLSSNWELSTVLQALDETKGAKLLADPHVTVVDRETATIDIVTKIPIQQLTQTQQGGAIGTTAFEEAGIKLNVTPRISNDGTVEMVVEPEFSTLTGFNNGNPVIDARRARTTVRVANQHTLVLGGLRQKTAVETVNGIPGLMNWKFVGRLFRTHNTEIRESELIVFIQPEIIDFCATGLPREEIAVSEGRRQLSRIALACAGAHVPDCKDPHCPYHHPRPRVNQGMPDEGLVRPFSFADAYTEAAPTSFEETPVLPSPLSNEFSSAPAISTEIPKHYQLIPNESAVQPVMGQPVPAIRP